MKRSRIEALLASFPKAADSGTQHTTVEQDNVRFVYQPLDELYIVLITNKQSNILQDIDSLHLFAQVVSSTCKTLDEREILRNAFELLSAFDEIVTLGYRENLSISQIKTFLEMESHEERIQEIIARVCADVKATCGPAIPNEIHRIKNWRLPKSARERQSNWRCSGRSRQDALELDLAHQYIRRILPQSDPLLPRHTTPTRRKRTRPSAHSSSLLRQFQACELTHAQILCAQG